MSNMSVKNNRVTTIFQIYCGHSVQVIQTSNILNFVANLKCQMLLSFFFKLFS